MADAKRKHSLVYYLTAVVWTTALVLLDLKIKELVVEQLKGRSARSLIPGVLSLEYVENRGMAFGMLQDGRIFFIVTTVLVLIALALAYQAIPEKRRFVPLSAGVILIFSGAVGNLIDRVKNGFVVDYLRLDFIRFPVFNLADCYLTWTAAALALLLVFYYKNEDFREIRL